MKYDVLKNKVTIDINTGYTAKASLTIEGKESGKQYKIGYYDIPIGWGFYVDVPVYLKVDFSGEVSISYETTVLANTNNKSDNHS